MSTAYEVLNIATTADDAEIKQAYLRLVKDNPPDRDPEKFQIIHDAYSAIKDPKSRVSYALFTPPTVNFDTVIKHMLQTEHPVNFSAEFINQLLQASIDDATLVNATATPKK